MWRAIGILLVVTQLAGCAGAIMAGAVGGAVMVNDRRSMSTQIDDHALEVRIASALRGEEDLRAQARISAISMNQQVLLVGQVPTPVLRDKAVRIVSQVEGVTVVHDQLRQGSPVGFTTKSNDTWISTKVKSRMFSDGELDALRIKVITENGEVFLLGLVDRQEADLAVDVARTTAGVRKVVKVFEYQ
ncbi:division/outer membrane stress-associated lipid-binding lipoprotein [Ferrimonas marina]|uniref:Osmotically-inducible protein OsmY, contains BON domain n=1 Tax=Ferrimonas marina TaxID=299255 RepID=A0A1M5XGC4_9GAMM|nr:division/outer membrane stress-associated lipid-binding lipoprotein [Ferrimonas marina]SHH98836.1 Osmotically-inducible protein OsmY, contains BON domain [Ferrimonas marina]